MTSDPPAALLGAAKLAGGSGGANRHSEKMAAHGCFIGNDGHPALWRDKNTL